MFINLVITKNKCLIISIRLSKGKAKMTGKI
nr:MAG TPA: hypothetical protein [Myoviridae sp. ctfuG5]